MSTIDNAITIDSSDDDEDVHQEKKSPDFNNSRAIYYKEKEEEEDIEIIEIRKPTTSSSTETIRQIASVAERQSTWKQKKRDINKSSSSDDEILKFDPMSPSSSKTKPVISSSSSKERKDGTLATCTSFSKSKQSEEIQKDCSISDSIYCSNNNNKVTSIQNKISCALHTTETQQSPKSLSSTSIHQEENHLISIPSNLTSNTNFANTSNSSIHQLNKGGDFSTKNQMDDKKRATTTNTTNESPTFSTSSQSNSSSIETVQKELKENLPTYSEIYGESSDDNESTISNDMLPSTTTTTTKTKSKKRKCPNSIVSILTKSHMKAGLNGAISTSTTNNTQQSWKCRLCTIINENNNDDNKCCMCGSRRISERNKFCILNRPFYYYHHPLSCGEELDMKPVYFPRPIIQGTNPVSDVLKRSIMADLEDTFLCSSSISNTNRRILSRIEIAPHLGGSVNTAKKKNSDSSSTSSTRWTYVKARIDPNLFQEYALIFNELLPSGFEILFTKKNRNSSPIVFYNGEQSTCTTHFDRDNSILYILSGQKEVLLASKADMKNMKGSEKIWGPGDGIYQHITPFQTDDKTDWQNVILNAGDALYLPKQVVHSIQSKADTLALSFQVRKRMSMPETIVSHGDFECFVEYLKVNTKPSRNNSSGMIHHQQKARKLVS